MNAVLTWWAMLDPMAQAAILAALVGAVASGVQWFWTRCPWLPWLAPDAPTIRKWVVAVFVAAIGAAEVAQGDVSRFLVAFIAAFGTSQATYNTGKAIVGKPEPAPDPQQSSVGDDV